ncbi:PAS domain-containing hybrid sensor histidine kinase/response regulator [Caenimonas aquaedulcis]|uniref:histidine kinase n=1 Tax=Caenimonas aquaedulcis TaxID=2793270 RepID=A0A931H4R5_9BURK|nr:PAS domain S-box protein [Caenimonas aquaedulcis]MBG9388425.1 PAS domain S-box protein [Caenimonas aquaedulcis]
MEPDIERAAGEVQGTDRFRLLVDSVVDYGIFMLDPAGNVASWNTGAERIKGYTRAEVIGRHFSMFYTQEARDRGWPEHELRAATREGRFEDEGWRVRKDGSQFWANVVITALHDRAGGLAGFGKVTRDLTERRQHEEAMRESEERLRLLVEGVRDYAIFMLSPDGMVESWNSGAELLIGYRAGEIIGSHFSRFYRPEDAAAGQPAAELETALRVGRAEGEGWRIRKDGSAFWANVAVSPVRDAHGVLRGFAKVTRDMSDRRRLEQLENSSRRMNEFLAMLAHELRNPLAPIRNAVTVLQLEPSPSPIVRSSRDMIDRQLTHMTRLVDDLLDVGRLTSGKVRLKKERILYNQVVARAVEGVRPLMDARHHEFHARVPSADIHVMADATRLTQVIQNLLTNAAKYTPAAGRIELEASVDNGVLTTRVTDNGAGLSEPAREQIFELFFQGAEQGQSKESGLGIGLTLAKSLVEMHGGSMQAKSPGPGLGSTFSFTIPNATMEGRGGADGGAGSARVLIIDDNRDAADSLAEILRLMGCSVKTAYDGPTGIARAKEYAPHAALVDLGMPDMNGFEVLKALRVDSPRLLVAAVTGYGNEEDKQRTTAAGFDLHFVKPVDFATLQALVGRLVP